ncbi:rhodanese-like domain-containing protein [bacterium SCSIO 12741]|nr:rhodanese-like domain-containing protein [bacterium SCSIO 12741]
MENITPVEWKEKLSNDSQAVIVDVRTPGECSEGIQPGAIQLDIMNGQRFMEETEKWDRNKNYYVYCRSGNRSGQACQYLSGKGFTTFNLLGGMMTWDGEVVAP